MGTRDTLTGWDDGDCLAFTTAGYYAGWMGEVELDDVIVISKKNYDRLGEDDYVTIDFVRVKRILKERPNHDRVVEFIGVTDSGVDRHYTYGNSYPTYIWRES